MAARNMYRIEINIEENIVRQVDYLQGSNNTMFNRLLKPCNLVDLCR